MAEMGKCCKSGLVVKVTNKPLHAGAKAGLPGSNPPPAPAVWSGASLLACKMDLTVVPTSSGCCKY